jgi:NADH-quinone oxidoreductase subunit L
VIHAVDGEQDMNRMGGLWRKIPITHATMLIGTIAIAGIPPLAGFFSKDEILGEAFKTGFYWVWIIGVVVAVMTAFYMWRLMGKTFYGESRVDPAVVPHVHESAWQMTLPLILLSIPSIGLGLLIGLPLGNGLLVGWLKPVFAQSEEILKQTPTETLFGLPVDAVLIVISVAAALAGLISAFYLFGPRKVKQGKIDAISNANGATRFLYRASLNKWWFDELNDLLFIRIGGRVAAFLWWFDRTIVDGTVNGVGTVVRDAGGGLRQIQTGRVQNYALGIAIGLLVMAGSFLLIVGQPR